MNGRANVALDVFVWVPAHACLVFGLAETESGCPDTFAATLLPFAERQNHHLAHEQHGTTK